MKKLVFIAVICLAFVKGDFSPVHLFMMGDSAMANKPVKAFPEIGWGQVLHY